MEHMLKTIIQEKIKKLKSEIQEVVSYIEMERKENIGEDKIIYQHFEDKKDILLGQIEELKESLAYLETQKPRRYTISNNGKKRSLVIVSPVLADPTNGFIPSDSPLAKALKGKQKGDNVEVVTPIGISNYKLIATE